MLIDRADKTFGILIKQWNEREKHLSTSHTRQNIITAHSYGKKKKKYAPMNAKHS